MIDIKHQQGARHAVASPTLNLASKRDTKTPAIGQTCQRIEVGVSTQQIDFLSQENQLLSSLDQQIEFAWQREVIKSTFDHRAVPQAHGRMF